MTNKINGIDVSECMYYSKKQQIYSATKPLYKMEDCCMLSDSVSSCLEKDCYYKQLKHLQEENKELKERLFETKQFLKDDYKESLKFCQKIEAYQLSENEAKEIIAELKHENEQLKKPCLVIPKVKQLAVPIEKYEKLQEENKRLQMLSCANCGEKYLSPDGAELYEKNVQLQKENEELKKRQITKNGFICDCEQNAKYKQALEEIRIISQNWTSKLMNDGYCEILDKIDEVLYDRD